MRHLDPKPSADDLIDAVCADEDEVIAAFAHWLKMQRKPDDWHKYVLGTNWDVAPPEMFRWIALQDECDQATALALFWKSQPEYYLDFVGDRSRVPQFAIEGLDLVDLVRERWTSRSYKRAELAFEREVDAWPVDFAALERKHGARVELELPSSMRIDLPGRRLTLDGCIDGIPERFWPEDLR